MESRSPDSAAKQHQLHWHDGYASKTHRHAYRRRSGNSTVPTVIPGRRIAALDILKNEPTQSRISVQKKKGGGIYGKVIFAHQVLFHEKA
ncbi:hypothetical protein MCOR11_000891 [Pyricularia oryzae]|nr:hypothetical protein MCOR11_000891 [Pyricularia oryzae]